MKIILVLTFAALAMGCSDSYKSPPRGGMVLGPAPAINTALVKECAAGVSEGTTLTIDRIWLDRCETTEPDRFAVHYGLARENGGIRLTTPKKYFVPAPALFRDFNGVGVSSTLTMYRVARVQIEQAKPCISEFFKRHGLTYEPDFEFVESMSEIPSGVNLFRDVIYLTTASGRSNWRLWLLGGEPVCTLAIHELAHHLGLPDRYPEPDACPTRETVVMNQNIMTTHYGAPYALSFLELDVKLLVSPMCDLGNRAFYVQDGDKLRFQDEYSVNTESYTSKRHAHGR